MLGQSLSDPYGYDSGHKGSVIAGMGLLDSKTDFVDTKRTIQMKGRFGKVEGLFHGLSGKEFYGYEIHSGVTSVDPAHALTEAGPINEAGETSAEGSQTVRDKFSVYGTYMHGIFDAEGVAATVVEALLAKGPVAGRREGHRLPGLQGTAVRFAGRQHPRESRYG